MTAEMKLLLRWFDECDVIIRTPAMDQSTISRACKLQTTVVELMIKLNQEENNAK